MVFRCLQPFRRSFSSRLFVTGLGNGAFYSLLLFATTDRLTRASLTSSVSPRVVLDTCFFNNFLSFYIALQGIGGVCHAKHRAVTKNCSKLYTIAHHTLLIVAHFVTTYGPTRARLFVLTCDLPSC